MQQIGAADDHGTSCIHVQGDLPCLGQVFDLRGGLLDDRLQIELDKRLARRRLRLRKRQQRLRKLLDPQRQRAAILNRLPKFLRRPRPLLRNVGLHQDAVDRIEDLVGQVGVEPRLRDPDRIEPVEHAVERGGHAHEFGISMRKVDPRGEVALRDAACGPGNAGQRHHHPRQDPPHRQSQRWDGQRDRPCVEPEHVPQRLLQLPQGSAHEQHRLVASPTARQPNVAVGRGPDGLHPVSPLRLPGEAVW